MMKKFMKKIMNKVDCKYMIILIGIISVWAVVLFFCLFRPHQDFVQQMRDESVWQKNSLEALEQFKQDHGSLKEYETRLKAEQSILGDKLPNKMNEGDFLLNVSQAAGHSGVQLLSLEPVSKDRIENTDKPGIECREFSVSCRGNFFAVLRFLRSLNAMPRLVIVKSGLLKTENTSIYCNLTLQIYADTYNI